MDHVSFFARAARFSLFAAGFLLVTSGCSQSSEKQVARNQAPSRVAADNHADVSQPAPNDGASSGSVGSAIRATGDHGTVEQTSAVVADPGRVVTADGATSVIGGARVERDEMPTRDGGILAPDLVQDSDQSEFPRVIMSEQHSVTCLARVGDTLPSAQLTDLNGREQDLAKLCGDRLTVLFFFSARDRHSLDELRDMAADVASPLAVRGVRVVGICEDQQTDAARRACAEAGVSFPVLVDQGGKYFRQLATSHLERTYLVDASGKILWFDIEYGRATRHDLREALRSLL